MIYLLIGVSTIAVIATVFAIFFFLEARRYRFAHDFLLKRAVFLK